MIMALRTSEPKSVTERRLVREAFLDQFMAYTTRLDLVNMAHARTTITFVAQNFSCSHIVC